MSELGGGWWFVFLIFKRLPHNCCAPNKLGELYNIYVIRKPRTTACLRVMKTQTIIVHNDTPSSLEIMRKK